MLLSMACNIATINFLGFYKTRTSSGKPTLSFRRYEPKVRSRSRICVSFSASANSPTAYWGKSSRKSSFPEFKAASSATPASETVDFDDVFTKIPPGDRIHATVIMGFLGSGKTTLLNHILTADHGKRIAVIQNKYDEVDVDGSLVANKAAGAEDIVMLNNGCLCCSVRGDLVRVISELVRRKKGKFDHIVIETTGLANPAPIFRTFVTEDQVFNDVKLDGVVTLVDAMHAQLHINEVKPKDIINEAVQQIAYADRIIVNKTDLVAEPEVFSLVEQIRSINRMAQLKRTQYGEVDLDYVLGIGNFDLERINSAVEADSTDPHHGEHKHDYEFEHDHKHEHHRGHHSHDDRRMIPSLCNSLICRALPGYPVPRSYLNSVGLSRLCVSGWGHYSARLSCSYFGREVRNEGFWEDPDDSEYEDESEDEDKEMAEVDSDYVIGWDGNGYGKAVVRNSNVKEVSMETSKEDLLREIEQMLKPEEMEILKQNKLPNLEKLSTAKWNPLHSYALSGQIKFMDDVLEMGCNIDTVDKDGLTALHLAVIGKKEAVTSHLLRNGANPGAKDRDGAAPLHYAVQVGSMQTVKLLIKSKVDVNVSDNEGWTPLHVAIQTRNRDIAKILLLNGADTTRRNKDGNTALDISLCYGRDFKSYDLALLLKRHTSYQI